MSESPQHALGKRLRKPSVKIAASDSELTATDEVYASALFERKSVSMHKSLSIHLIIMHR
jgi:hypothetical protein